MLGALDLLEQLSDVVETEAGSERAEISRLDDESLGRRSRARFLQAAPQRVIDDLSKWTAGLP